ncbi:hypothetical protein [Jannaschia sp. R86511]|uniref:hypothetical protein n=1 Tax=Jannaschia sp. R86511 TaxID=3093853 RepID=UPI0036D233D6
MRTRPPRRRGPTGRVLAVAPLVTAALLLGGCGGSVGDACDSPALLLDESTVRPGQQVQVRGELFLDGCDDQGRGESRTPFPAVTLTWEQDGAVVDLVTVADVDGAGAFVVVVTVPPDAVPGEATLSADSAAPLAVVVSPPP